MADLIALLPQETADALLQKMQKEGSEEVEELLKYEDDTAGGIMVPDFIALKEDTTAREAIEAIQTEFADVEMPFFVQKLDQGIADQGRQLNRSFLMGRSPARSSGVAASSLS